MLVGAKGRLYDEQEIIEMPASILQPSEVQDIKSELWRGTIAAIVYSEFRVPSVHIFGPPDSTTFDETTFRGQPVPDIMSSMVHRCLKRIITAAKQISIETGKWFGHDYGKR